MPPPARPRPVGSGNVLVLLVLAGLLGSCAVKRSRIDVGTLPVWTPGRPPIPCLQDYEILSMHPYTPDHEDLDPTVRSTLGGVYLGLFRTDVSSFLRLDGCGGKPPRLHLRLHRLGASWSGPYEDSLDLLLGTPLRHLPPDGRGRMVTDIRILRIGAETPAAWSRRIAPALAGARDSGDWKTERPDRSRSRESDWVLSCAWPGQVPRTLLLELRTELEEQVHIDTATLDMDTRRLVFKAAP